MKSIFLQRALPISVVDGWLKHLYDTPTDPKSFDCNMNMCSETSIHLESF